MMWKRREFMKAAGLSALPLMTSNTKAANTDSIIRKAVPTSGVKIPVIGIGTNRYGVGDDVAAMQPLKAVLAEFAKIGGGVIDTAPMYGNSETVLGKLIGEQELGDDFFIATKCDVEGGAATQRQLESSEQKLQSGNLDLVAVHNLKNWQDQLPVLREAKQQGKIGHIGITTSRDRQYQEFKKILESERLDFMQINYSLADRDAESLLDLALYRGVAVMVNLPFGRGKLFSAVAGQPLPDWASEFQASSWAQFFLNYVISHPAVVCAIPGTRKLHHLQDNLAAGLGRLPDDQERRKMEALYDAL